MTLAGAVLAGVERTLVPLDGLRRELYRALVPWLGPWIRDREVRVGIHASLVVLGSLVGAVVAPLWLLALGPLLLGVPHLVADLRYLVVRPGLHRRLALVPVAALVLASSAMVDLRWGLAGVVLAALTARASWAMRALVSVPATLLFAASLWALHSTSVALAHVHNLIAVVLWVALAVALHDGASLGRARWVPVAGFALGGAALFTGAFDAVVQAGPALGPSLESHARVLAPGLDPVWAGRWVVAFAFAQAVHYGLWLRVVPEEGRVRPSPRSWAASLSALRKDFGDPLLAAAVVLTAGIALWGLVDLTAAREGYLRLALFHGPLELAVIALVCAEGRAVLRP